MRVLVPSKIFHIFMKAVLESETLGDLAAFLDRELPDKIEIIIDRGEGLETLELLRGCEEDFDASSLADLYVESYRDAGTGTCYHLLIDGWNYPINTSIRDIYEEQGINIVFYNDEDEENIYLTNSD